MHERRKQLVEEIRTAERARELLAGLERRLKERDRSDLEEHLGRLERLAGSLPEAHTVRAAAARVLEEGIELLKPGNEPGHQSIHTP